MVTGLEHLSVRSPYPDIVVDGVYNLVSRPCTMISFDASRFPDLMSRFNESYSPETLLASRGFDSLEENERLLEARDNVERWFAESLWESVLDPSLEGLSSEIVAAPYRDTMFESAVYRDHSLRWKIEAYLFTVDGADKTISEIRRYKTAYLRSLEGGTVPTEESKAHKLEEIRTKGELFEYPDCCRSSFAQQREARFEALLGIGDDRIVQMRQDNETTQAVDAAFGKAVTEEGITMQELNPERRIIEQLENLDIGTYFEEWSYETLLSFFRRKSNSELPGFFYGFFSEEFHPHHPRCSDAITVGRRIEAELKNQHPDLVPVYRIALVLNLFSYLGFGDRSLRRQLLEDIWTAGADG